MTARVLPDGAPWRAVNGWGRLLSYYRGQMPAMIPHTLVIPVTTTATGGAADQETSTSGTATADRDADFYVCALSVGGFNAAAPDNGQLGNDPTPDNWAAFVSLRQNAGGPPLTSSRVRVSHIFGDAGRPFLLPVPWVIPPGGTIVLKLDTRSTQVFNARFSFVGFKKLRSTPPLPVDFWLSPRVLSMVSRVRELGSVSRIEPFIYSLAFEPTQTRAPGQVEQRTFTVSDADFACGSLMGTCENASVTGAAVDPVDASVLLSVNQGQSRLSNAPMPFSNVFGTARNTMRLNPALILRRTSTVTAVLNINTGPTGIGALNCQMAFPGVRFFDDRGLRA